MPEPLKLNNFSDEWVDRLQESVIYTERSRLQPSGQRRRTPAPSNLRKADDIIGGTGGGGCCCNESDCVTLPGVPYTTPIKPVVFTFFPRDFRCGCDPAGDAGSRVYMYPKGPNKWRSKHLLRDPLMCLGTESEPVPCTVTSLWIWRAGATAPCSGTYTFDVIEGVMNFNVVNNCTCIECTGDIFGWADDWFAEHGSIPPDGTYTIPCDTDVTCDGGHWELVSTDGEAGCVCTPLQPDYDGSVEGETAETTCDSTRLVDGTEMLLESYWELDTTPGKDYYGCCTQSLKFYVGLRAVLTYYLTDRCGEHPKCFCMQCTNTFKLANCGPTQCEAGIPTVICLVPSLREGESSNVLGCCSPATWQLKITGLAGELGGYAEFLCPLANGDFVMSEADPTQYYITDGKPVWVYNFLGATPYELMENPPLGTPDDIARFYGGKLWYVALYCDGVNDGVEHPELLGLVSMHLEIYVANSNSTCPEDAPCWPPDSICSTKGVLCGDFEIYPTGIYLGHVNVLTNSFKCDDEVKESTLINYAATQCNADTDDITVYIKAL